MFSEINQLFIILLGFLIDSVVNNPLINLYVRNLLNRFVNKYDRTHPRTLLALSLRKTFLERSVKMTVGKLSIKVVVLLTLSWCYLHFLLMTHSFISLINKNGILNLIPITSTTGNLTWIPYFLPTLTTSALPPC